MSRRAQLQPTPQTAAESLAEANRRDALEWQGLELWCHDPETKVRAQIMRQAHEKAALAWQQVEKPR